MDAQCPLCDAPHATPISVTAVGYVYRCGECDKTFLVPNRDPLANAPTLKRRADALEITRR